MKHGYDENGNLIFLEEFGSDEFMEKIKQWPDVNEAVLTYLKNKNDGNNK